MIGMKSCCPLMQAVVAGQQGGVAQQAQEETETITGLTCALEMGLCMKVGVWLRSIAPLTEANSLGGRSRKVLLVLPCA
jgi:hypothetical protein